MPSFHNQTANDVTEQVVKGNIAIIKHTDNGETQIETPEGGAEFAVYLKAAGSYENAKSSERDYLTCDENGFAQTKELPYGIYTVHQVSGWEGSEKMPDFDVFIAQNGTTYRYLINNTPFESYLALSDTMREESADMLRRLTQLGIHPVLLTGDHPDVASAIAGQLGIREVQANCLPEDKLRIIRGYQEKGEAVCMIGDGVNDAPALKAANVGVAMGGVGSAIAVDAADIALVDDEIKELPHLLALSRRMMITIKLNMTFSMALNFVAIVLAIIGTLSPVIGALVHNAGSVLVIINSALLLKWRKKEWLSTSSAR